MAHNELTEHEKKDWMNVITLLAVLVDWPSQSQQKTSFLKTTVANDGLMAENTVSWFAIFALASTETHCGASGANSSSTVLTGCTCKHR